jgi:hypothetical protein
MLVAERTQVYVAQTNGTANGRLAAPLDLGHDGSQSGT